MRLAPPIVALAYTYDKASDRLTAENKNPVLFFWNNRDYLYQYDGLHRLTEAKRIASGSALFQPVSQKWALDLLGNWTSVWADASGDGLYDNATERETRVHNTVNELDYRDPDADPGTPNLDLTHDKNGNLKTEQIGTGATTATYTHDAWNRLVKVERSDTEGPRAIYDYNGLNWRIAKRADLRGAGATDPPDGTLDQKRLMYYSAAWQLLEERIDDNLDTAPGIDRHQQYVWGPRYIDDVILHRRDDGANGSYDFTFYHMTDVQFSPVAVIDDTARISERVSYSAYGEARHHRMADLNGDGAVASDDFLVMYGNWGSPGPADLNRDGTVDTQDFLLMQINWGPALPKGDLSGNDADNHPIDNQIGWDGYVFNRETQHYHVRFRGYSPALGRWVERDPVGYDDGMLLYCYAMNSPFVNVDPAGAAAGFEHHPYPLHLGGANEQPLFGLPKECHDAIHFDYFKEHGFGFGDKGRENWCKLSREQQRAHIMRSLRCAGVPNDVIRQNIEKIMAGAKPTEAPVKRFPARYGPVVWRMGGGALASGALTVCTITSTCNAPTIPIDWREKHYLPNTTCRCECSDFEEIWVVPSWWVVGGSVEKDLIKNPLGGWTDYGDISAEECKKLESPISADEMDGSCGYSIYKVTVSRCRWGGREWGDPLETPE